MMMPTAPQSPMPMPGQATAPTQPVMPNQQGPMPGIVSLTGPLQNVPKEMLTLELANPFSKLDKYAVMAVLNSKIAAEKALKNAQGLQAQAAVTQEPQTELERVMKDAQGIGGLMQAEPPVMARHGGAMRSYRQGGIVGYANGTPPEGAQAFPVPEQEDITTLPLNERIRRTLARLRRSAPGTDERTVNERLREALPDVSLPALRRVREESPRQWQQAAQGEEPDLMGETLIPFTEPDIGQAPNVAMLGKTGDPDIDIGPAQPRLAASQAKPPGITGVVPPAAPKPVLPPPLSDFDKAVAARRKTLEGRAEDKGLASLQEAQQAMLNLQTRQIDAREAARQKALAEAEAKKAAGFGFDDLMASLAGAKTGYGQFMPSVAGNVAEIRRTQADTYKQAVEAANKERQAIDALEIAREQQRVALAEGNVKRARELQDQIDALGIEAAKYRADRQDKQRELDLARERNEIAREGVEVQRISAMRQPEKIQFMEWLRSPANRKLNEEIESAKREEERRIKLYELYGKRPITAGEMSFEDFIIEFEKANGKASSTAGGPPPGAVRLKGQQ